jgi:predicted XRE-type DNA-binding protein
MTHGVFLHIHTDPDGIDTFDVIVARILKIPFFLGRNQSAHVEDCPVQDLIFAGFILLCFHINNDLRKAILHPHIKYNVKTHQAFVQFLNRIDDIITFKPLTQEQIAEVVELQMKRVKKMLEPQGFELRWTPAAIQYLAKVGYDPEFGARPVKRAIQDYVLNDLSKKILAEEVSREKPITIDHTDADGLVFKNQ